MTFTIFACSMCLVVLSRNIFSQSHMFYMNRQNALTTYLKLCKKSIICEIFLRKPLHASSIWLIGYPYRVRVHLVLDFSHALFHSHSLNCSGHYGFHRILFSSKCELSLLIGPGCRACDVKSYSQPSQHFYMSSSTMGTL